MRFLLCAIVLGPVPLFQHYLLHVWLDLNAKILLNFKIKVISSHPWGKMENIKEDTWGINFLCHDSVRPLWRWVYTHALWWKELQMCLNYHDLSSANSKVAFKYQLSLAGYNSAVLCELEKYWGHYRQISLHMVILSSEQMHAGKTCSTIRTWNKSGNFYWWISDIFIFSH